MLTSLCIENFAIVSQLELDFRQGMTAFTGETGAGKSIMIDALMLALGWRADASVIRPGQEKCDITACFHIDSHAAPAQWLNEHEVSHEEGEIFLRRVVNAEGRSKSYINGQPFPLQKIKELSEMLVDIHGQHQYQTLLQHATHRHQLDQFANHSHLLAEVEGLYAQCQNIKQQLTHIEKQTSFQERKQMLEQQLEELTELGLEEGEMQRLHEEHQLLHHAVEYLERTHNISTLLNGDEQTNVCFFLNQSLQLLANLPVEQSAVKTAAELLNSALIQCEEAQNEINNFAEQVQLDPERLQEVEDRISILHQSARKYHIDASQLPSHFSTLQTELNTLESLTDEHIQLKTAYQQHLQDYERAAVALRESRQVHAEKLAAEITAIIRKLGMPKGYIVVEITPLDKIYEHGQDKIEYKVCTNPGMTPDTLAKIASGGELSRISLAIHMLTAQRGATPTLLFDEVDVGIGGATAALVGELLRTLGERLQVFCVTHQPQVASYAHHHYIVEKFTQNEQTFSRIQLLEDQQKIDEIARMLGGITITEQTLSHAREMLESVGAAE
jgi:DNA repair protein RecN (Recombination protein N)